jgi:hypothetical protein
MLQIWFLQTKVRHKNVKEDFFDFKRHTYKAGAVFAQNANFQKCILTSFQYDVQQTKI